MDTLRTDVAELLAEIPMDFGGGCSTSKAYVMAYLIKRYRMRVTLDIGVYRGRSLFPQALSHKQFTGGVAYGVDPWSKEEARENDQPKLREQIDRFISETDFELIYRDVEDLRRTHGFENNCLLVRKTSMDAAGWFRERGVFFDLIHIDGNHDAATVMKDTELYLARLKPEGFLIMDDVSWESVKPAYAQVAARIPRILQRIDTLNDYAVFWNTDAKLKSIWLRILLMYCLSVQP